MAVSPVRHVRVPDDVWEPLRRLAAADDRTVSYIIVAALREYVARAREPAEREPARP